MKEKFFIIAFFSVFLLSMSWVSAADRLLLATTTSTENSGLLDKLIPPFENKYNIDVQVIAVGTGKAIRTAQNGDADIILVHARAAEDKFVAEGYGVNRRDVMYNDFIILGPSSDPVGIKGEKDVVKALRAIAHAKAPFISRGDDSGTHKREVSLWKRTGTEPQGAWYQETGQGMGATITIADEKYGYVLTDRGTYLAFKDKISLVIISEGDKLLFNPYGIIAVNPAKYPHVNYQGAMAFIGFITSQEGQRIIREYKRFGELLFKPMAIP